MCAMNQFGKQDRLAEALRQLAQESERAAPPELGLALASAFRRHHRRRRIKNAAVTLAVTGCLFSTTWLLIRPSTSAPRIVNRTGAGRIIPKAPPSTAPENTNTRLAGKKQAAKRPHARRAARGNAQLAARETGEFLPLPSYDPAVASSNELQIIRLRMPVQDLRLVGAPVNVAMPNRQVLADFVVGQDGTPYAVRVIQ